MKKVMTFLGVVMATLVLVLGLALPAQADTASATLASGQVYRGFFARAAEKVVVDGTVDGDVWAAGTEVVINGTVNGSVYAVGQNVTVNGTVTGNVQAAGSRVQINGKVKGALYAAGSEVALAKEASVQNGAVMMGSVVRLAGTVGNQTILAGSVLTVDGTVDGKLSLQGAQADLGSNAKVNGNLQYNQSLKINIANDKAISGSIVKTQEVAQAGPSLADRLRDILLGLLMTLVTGLAILLLVPRSSQAVADHLTKRPFESFFVGVGFIIFVPVAAILLLISFFGIQVAALLALGYIAVLVVGELFVALCIGNFITRPKRVHFGGLATSFIVGLVLLTAAKLIPFVGGVVAFVAFIMGVGALVSRTGRRFKELRKAQVTATK